MHEFQQEKIITVEEPDNKLKDTFSFKSDLLNKKVQIN